MRKIMLILVSVACVLALGGVMASAYLGATGSNAACTITAVADADLSLEIPNNKVANDVAELLGDGTIRFDLTEAGIGPWSCYVYKDILIVDNKKDYCVGASVDPAHLSLPPNSVFVVAATHSPCTIPFPGWGGGPSPLPNWVILDESGKSGFGATNFVNGTWPDLWDSYLIYKYDRRGGGPIETEKARCIASGSQMYVSMMLCVPAGAAPSGPYNFELVWTAARYSSHP